MILCICVGNKYERISLYPSTNKQLIKPDIKQDSSDVLALPRTTFSASRIVSCGMFTNGSWMDNWNITWQHRKLSQYNQWKETLTMKKLPPELFFETNMQIIHKFHQTWPNFLYGPAYKSFYTAANNKLFNNPWHMFDLITSNFTRHLHLYLLSTDSMYKLTITDFSTRHTHRGSLLTWFCVVSIKSKLEYVFVLT